MSVTVDWSGLPGDSWGRPDDHAHIIATGRTSVTLRSILLFPALVLAYCGQPQPFEPRIPVPLDESFLLRVQQSAMVSGTPLRIYFAGIQEDSRCATDVVCVWAGNARVRLEVERERDSTEVVDLNTGLDPRSIEIPGYGIALEEVQPETRSGSSIQPADYVIRLRVTRLH